MRPRLSLTARTTAPGTSRGRQALLLTLVPLALTLLLAPAGRAVRRTPAVDVAERVRAAVVNIHSERTVMAPSSEDILNLAPSQNHINGMGTGVLIDPRGYIVTNEHVVEDVSLIQVRLSDGSTHSARVLARDRPNDLALLKIDAGRPLPIITLGTASDLMVGETVIAVGNAYGYPHTVSVGVVSAVNRDVTLNKEISYKALIQTDASINPGNSGGPLLNVNGEVVGINVAIRAGAQGISFAIPVDTMIRVTAELIGSRRRKVAVLGLVCRNQLEPVPAGPPGSPPPEGVVRSLVVERIEPEGPAAKAGFHPGDVVTQVGDLPTVCTLELERALLDCSAGDHVPVVVRRKGAEQRLDLVLEPAAQEESTPELVWRKLGLRLSPVNGELVSRTNERFTGGLTVLEVSPDGVAAQAGIQHGDILVGLHQWKMLTLDNVSFVLNHHDLASFNPLCFYIIRTGQVHRGWFRHVE